MLCHACVEKSARMDCSFPEGVAFLGDGQAKGGVSSPKKAAARGAGAPRAPKNGLHKLQM